MQPRARRERPEPSEATLRARANEMLGRRALTRIGPRQYAIQGRGVDHAGQPNVWHVDLDLNLPFGFCDCPAFLNWPRGSQQRCKHTTFLQQAEKLLAMMM